MKISLLKPLFEAFIPAVMKDTQQQEYKGQCQQPPLGACGVDSY